MKYVKNFENFRTNEEIKSSPAPAPVKPERETERETETERPTKPERPERPQRPERPDRIERPNVDPDPQAKDKKKRVTANDVAKRFISEMNAKGEKIEKYIKK